MTPSLHSVLEALYASEINGGVEWFWDGGLDLTLGDTMNGVRERGNVRTVDDAVRWFIENAKRHWPDSEFAKGW